MEQPNDILACPFCGKPARLIEEARGQYKVECTFIGACYGNWRPDYSTHKAATSRWNMRAGAPEHGRTESLLAVRCSAWLDALRESVESADLLFKDLRTDKKYLTAVRAQSLRDNLEKLRRQIESASNEPRLATAGS